MDIDSIEQNKFLMPLGDRIKDRLKNIVKNGNKKTNKKKILIILKNVENGKEVIQMKILVNMEKILLKEKNLFQNKKKAGKYEPLIWFIYY